MGDRTKHDDVGGLTAQDPLFEAVLDVRIAAMHRLLDAMAPISVAGALRTLREAFPEASLGERVRILSEIRH
jgi:hypothetical protein